MTSIRGDEGAPDAYMSVGTELAEMRRVVHILEVQRDIYRLLIEMLPLTTVGVLDEKLRWVNVFGEWPQQHGLSSAQLTGEDFGERMGGPDAEQCGACTNRLGPPGSIKRCSPAAVGGLKSMLFP